MEEAVGPLRRKAVGECLGLTRMSDQSDLHVDANGGMAPLDFDAYPRNRLTHYLFRYPREVPSAGRPQTRRGILRSGRTDTGPVLRQRHAAGGSGAERAELDRVGH